jgi:hypothetical protein
LAEKYIELLEEENLMESFSFSRKYFNANSENYLSGVAKESFNSKMREYYASKIDGGDYSA